MFLQFFSKFYLVMLCDQTFSQKIIPSLVMRMNSAEINFRKLRLDDLSLMLRWLNSAFVSRWYGRGNYAYDDVLAKYGSRITGESPTEPYLICYGQTPVGYIQTYRIVDHPAYNALVQADEYTAGVDLFIGEARYANQGLGTAALRRFLKEVVFAKAGIKACVLGPDPENKAAIRVYEKVGFSYVKIISQPDGSGDEYLMRIERTDLRR